MFGTDLGSAHVPGQGLFLSVLAHCFFALATLLVPWSYWFPPDARLLTMQEQARAEQALLLPDLQPMGAPAEPAPAPGSGHKGRKSLKPAAGSEGASSAQKAVRGVVHEGPQIIVSNPPRPDNYQQTILQPDLPPARLPAPLPIPPMVALARATPVLAAPAPQPQPPQEVARPVPVLPASVSQQIPKVEVPKLPVPASDAPQTLSTMAGAPLPAALPKLARAPVPLAGQSGDADHTLIVIDAVPVAGAGAAQIPAGELHGAFTVAPSGMIASGASGAAGGGTAAAGAPGIGNGTGTAAGPSAGAGSTPGAGSGTAAGLSGGAGSASGTGEGASGAGVANGTGLATGTGIGGGAGEGRSAGSGSGTGTGLAAGRGTGVTIATGSGPFPGITIQGGNSGGARVRNSVPPSRKRQSTYDVTIVANGASGGGFRDYGVFQDGASYTVYLDMSDAGLRTGWPLQYAPYFGPNRADPPIQGALQPPFAISKSLPRIPAEAARRSHGGAVVVFGIINANGRWESLRVMQSADPAFNRIVLDALATWTFKPATAGGNPVAVKCLLGLPVYSLIGE